jgi:GntR family transcriptional repressor for pyruvate dehydrogenase complex
VARPQPKLRPVARQPLYEQITDRLREFIDVNRLQPGDRLMTEREFAVELGVSRHSVRQAMAAMSATGMLEIDEPRTTSDGWTTR